MSQTDLLNFLFPFTVALGKQIYFVNMFYIRVCIYQDIILYDLAACIIVLSILKVKHEQKLLNKFKRKNWWNVDRNLFRFHCFTVLWPAFQSNCDNDVELTIEIWIKSMWWGESINTCSSCQCISDYYGPYAQKS